MMWLAALLLVQTPAPDAEAVPHDDPEIVVLGKKLSEVGLEFRADRVEGKTVLTSCTITKPSGDAEIDAIPCRVTEACVALQHKDSDDLVDCVKKRGREEVRALVGERRKKREAS